MIFLRHPEESEELPVRRKFRYHEYKIRHPNQVLRNLFCDDTRQLSGKWVGQSGWGQFKAGTFDTCDGSRHTDFLLSTGTDYDHFIQSVIVSFQYNLDISEIFYRNFAGLYPI